MPQLKYGKELISVINNLHKTGINKFSVIMRHSARQYDDDFQKEPFMPLTEEGRNLAYDLGRELPAGLSASFFSSFIGRCVETAYLIDKGYVNNNNNTITKNNVVSEQIAPFYIRNMQQLTKIILKQEIPVFIRNWIDGKIPESVLQNAETASASMFSYILDSFQKLSENAINIFVTHDWNMFLLKEFGTGLRHEDFGKIEYLEGLVLFEKNEEIFITHHQTEPKLLLS